MQENGDYLVTQGLGALNIFGDVNAFLKDKVNDKCTNLQDFQKLVYQPNECGLKYPTQMIFQKITPEELTSLVVSLVSNEPEKYLSDQIVVSEYPALPKYVNDQFSYVSQILLIVTSGILVLISLLYIQISSSKKLFVIYFQNGYSFFDITSKTVAFQIFVGVISIGITLLMNVFIQLFMLLYIFLIASYIGLSVGIEYLFYRNLEKKMEHNSLVFTSKILYFPIRIFRIYCFFTLIGISISLLISFGSLINLNNNTKYNKLYQDYYYIGGSSYSGLGSQDEITNLEKAFKNIDQTKLDAFIVALAMGGRI